MGPRSKHNRATQCKIDIFHLHFQPVRLKMFARQPGG
jgi:hypothetical protein